MANKDLKMVEKYQSDWGTEYTIPTKLVLDPKYRVSHKHNEVVQHNVVMLYGYLQSKQQRIGSKDADGRKYVEFSSEEIQMMVGVTNSRVSIHVGILRNMGLIEKVDKESSRYKYYVNEA